MELRETSLYGRDEEALVMKDRCGGAAMMGSGVIGVVQM